MSNPYAANKAALHVDRLVAIREGRVSVPVHVHFIISDLCNQDCAFCAYRIDGYTELFAVEKPNGTVEHNPNRMIPDEKAMEILGDFAEMGVKAVQFTGGGEPTVHPHCAQLMSYARQSGMETALVTNGVMLHKVMEQAVDCTWVRISIDAGTKETYATMRRVPESHFDRVLGNVSNLVAERDRAHSKTTIGIGFVVNKDNWEEIEDGVRIARGLGVDNVRLSAVFQPDDDAYFKEFATEAHDACMKAMELTTDRFMVINNFSERLSDLIMKHPDYKRCPYQSLVTYVGADLNVYRCCVTSYTEYGLLGTLNGKSFRELWCSPEVREKIREFDAHDCPRCQFNDKNRAINAMIDGLPDTHGNFV